MPLPGGPSDKLGNRFELRWIVRRIVDLITGRLQWIRIEPPGQDAIEFRCGSAEHEQAHQVKRGLSVGHWTVAALAEVLEGFGALLDAEPSLSCVFVSEHAAPELKELAERARASSHLEEFLEHFVAAKTLAKAWTDINARWKTGDPIAWQRLQQISMVSVSEKQLEDDTDALLDLLFEGPPAVARAALTELALVSVHQRLTREDVLRWLENAGIRQRAISAAAIKPTTSAPVATGIRRASELQLIAERLSAANRTILLGGVSGIGKSTVASQFASEWAGPVCWIDCGLLSSQSDALLAIADFARALGTDAVRTALSRVGVSALSVARAAGQVFDAHSVLLVWDGVDDAVAETVLPLIDAISGTQVAGAQLVTAQRLEVSGRSAVTAIHVGRLNEATVRSLLAAAFPEARVADLERAETLTGGHPYLVQLLTGAATNLNLDTALNALGSGGGSTSLIAELVSDLPPQQRGILTSLAWLAVPFSGDHVVRLGGSADLLRDLASRFLVVRATPERYKVHELLVKLLKRVTPEDEALELHQRAALCLRGSPQLTWTEVRALLAHARAASMKDVVRHAGLWLLRYAAEEHLWSLAREAAGALVQDGGVSTEFYPHYILGKSSRTLGDLEGALRHYSNAEVAATLPMDRDVARYERASVLSELGRREEAEPIFSDLAQAEDAGTRAEALIALALGMGRRGDTDAALRVIDDAAAVARAGGAEREEAEAWQSAGILLAEAERWSDAREYLRKAHALRLALKHDAAWDVYGWFHLLACAVRVERALNDGNGARGAARSLWRFSLLSNNVEWEAQAAPLMCVTDPNPEDPEILAAVQKLRAIGHDPDRDPASRLRALEGVVLCGWSLGQLEPAIEAIVESLALGADAGIRPPMFVHLPHGAGHGEPIVQLPDGVYGLVMPPGSDRNLILNAATRIFDRRPELAKYAAVFEGTFGDRARNPNRPRRRPRKKRRRHSR